MKYSELAEIYENLESTAKRLEKTLYVSQALKKADTGELNTIVLLLEGRLYPAWDERETGVAKQMMLKAISTASGMPAGEIEREWKKTGDLGKVAENLIARKRQVTLKNEELTVLKVFNNLRKLSEITGKGSVDRKTLLIAELLTSASPREACYIVRTILQTMRVGVGSGVMRDAIVWAFFPRVMGLFKEQDNEPAKRVLNAKSPEDARNTRGYDAIRAEDEKTARDIYNSFADSVQQAYDRK
ncbi:hypothetical protein HYY72_03160 [Candidatus Woesearchaeota archaeon]|nr:hypothetical protein [Candidatus Woesearchaeota archaeon]